MYSLQWPAWRRGLIIICTCGTEALKIPAYCGILCPMRSESPQHLSHGRQHEWLSTNILLDERATIAGPIDFATMFGNNHLVELEIGTGKGTFLAARATARPEINFLGIEWAKSYAMYAADRFSRSGLGNVRMLGTDAGPFVKKCIPAGSLWRVHIYFPDPWPKKRHHRRRLIQTSFLEQVHRILKPGGQVLIVTDHLDYFEHIQRVFTTAKGLVPISFPQMADRQGETVGTNFERKYIAQGRPFFKIAALRYG
jgi:tRNA (guanine-N7-)-methyltransferase